MVDPEELLRLIERLEATEFSRFRAELLAAGQTNGQAGGKFRDPAGDMFAVLHGLQTVENARRNVLALERLLAVVRELNQGQASGLTQLDLDRIDGALEQTRRGLAGALRQYRDKLDALKVELGLAPGAPIVADRGSLAAFREGSEAIDAWSRDPNREMTDLPRLAGHLPVLGDVLVGGHSVFAALDLAPDQLETVLTAAARVARGNRPAAAKGGPRDPAAAAAALELRVRNRVRSLDETRLAYRLRLRSLVLAVRLKDHAFERVIAPSPAGAYLTRSPLLKDLVDQEAEIVRLQNNLLALWAAFQGGRLELYRDLGTLPYDDWKSFSESLSAPRCAPSAGPTPGRPEPPGRPWRACQRLRLRTVPPDRTASAGSSSGSGDPA